jgi:2,5-diamino-6-(ribosylamino)-4(3H)-pyrimidinone 5'-phosphate reductase
MPQLGNEKIEELNELLEDLRGLASKGVPIIVEGSEDVEALRALGVRGKFHKISSGKTLVNFVEGLSGSGKAIILTDLDRTGERLAKFCAKHLKRLGVEPIEEIREKLKPLVQKDIREIEALAKFLQSQSIASRR